MVRYHIFDIGYNDDPLCRINVEDIHYSPNNSPVLNDRFLANDYPP